MTTHFFLCMSAIVKDESPYLEEWISFHMLHGFQHFFIYDNNSKDGTASTLQPFINHGLVTLIHWPKQEGLIDAHNHSIFMHRGATEWLAFFDIDEFVYIESGEKLIDRLRGVQADVGMMKVPWRNIGFSGHVERPEGLVIENFTRAEDLKSENYQIGCKVIVRPRCVERMYVHYAKLSKGKIIDIADRPENENSFVASPDLSRGRLNHYFTKSVAEYRAKVERGSAVAGTEKWFFEMDQQTDCNTCVSVDASTISDVKNCLREIRQLSTNPAVYGRFLPREFPRHDSTAWTFEKAMSYSLYGVPEAEDKLTKVTDRFEPLKIATDIEGVKLYVVSGATAFDTGRISEEYHFQNFMRRSLCRVVYSHPCHGSSSKFTVSIASKRKIYMLPFVRVLGCGETGKCLPPNAIDIRFGSKLLALSVPHVAMGDLLFGLLPMGGHDDDGGCENVISVEVNCSANMLWNRVIILEQN